MTESASLIEAEVERRFRLWYEHRGQEIGAVVAMHRTLRVVIYCCILIAAVAVAIFLSRQAAKPQLLGSARAEVVPAQTLRLIDGHLHDFGTLSLGSDGAISLQLTDSEGGLLSQWAALPSASWLNEGEVLSIYGGVRKTHGSQGKAFLNVMVHPGRLVFDSYLPDGAHRTVWSKGWHHSTVAALVELSRNYVVPPEREHTLGKEVSSEDLRLMTRDGKVFAALGLNEGAEPSLALLRNDGGLFAVLTLTEKGMFAVGGPKEWPMLTLFDKYGRLQLTVEFGPEPEPVLTIFEKADSSSSDLGIYALDRTGSREVPVQQPFSDTNRERAIAWLPQKVSAVLSPVALVDERGKVLWQSSGK